MLQRRYITAVVLAVLVAISSVSVAAPPETSGKPILDQFNTVLSSLINGGSAEIAWQQGITAGIAGQLTRIDLYVQMLEGIEAAETEISVTLGAPWQSGVPEWTTTTKVKPGWNSFHLNSAKIVLAVGDEYAIGIHGQSATQYQFNPGFGISDDEQYPGGDLFLNAEAGGLGKDLLFRTYVSPKRGQHE